MTQNWHTASQQGWYGDLTYRREGQKLTWSQSTGTYTKWVAITRGLHLSKAKQLLEIQITHGWNERASSNNLQIKAEEHKFLRYAWSVGYLQAFLAKITQAFFGEGSD